MSILEDLLKENPSLILHSKYENIKKLTNGSFSDIFTAQVSGKFQNVILKAPHKTKTSYADISKEAILLLKLKELDVIPRVLYLQADEKCEVLVIEKLGLSLEVLKEETNNFSLKTTVIIACQLLDILKAVHSKGVLHRDIKPSNLLVGQGQYKNKIYLIDFDISTTFTDISLKEIQGNQFIGTKAFASRNAHKCCSFSRKDDLESLIFTLIYLYEGQLPWNHKKCDLVKLGDWKNHIIQKEFPDELPKEFSEYLSYLDDLKFEAIPDYEHLKELFLSMAKRFNLNIADGECEWEGEESIQNNARNEKKEVLAEKKDDIPKIRKSSQGQELVSNTESDDSLQKKMIVFNSFHKKQNPKFMPNNSSTLMKGFKQAFLKNTSLDVYKKEVTNDLDLN